MNARYDVSPLLAALPLHDRSDDTGAWESARSSVENSCYFILARSLEQRKTDRHRFTRAVVVSVMFIFNPYYDRDSMYNIRFFFSAANRRALTFSSTVPVEFK